MLHARALFAVLDIEMSLRLYLTHEQWTNYSDLNKRRRRRWERSVTGEIWCKVERITLGIDCIISRHLLPPVRLSCDSAWNMDRERTLIVYSLSLNGGTVFNFLRRTIDPWWSEMSSYVVSRPFLSKTSCPFLRLLSWEDNNGNDGSMREASERKTSLQQLATRQNDDYNQE